MPVILFSARGVAQPVDSGERLGAKNGHDNKRNPHLSRRCARGPSCHVSSFRSQWAATTVHQYPWPEWWATATRLGAIADAARQPGCWGTALGGEYRCRTHKPHPRWGGSWRAERKCGWRHRGHCPVDVLLPHRRPFHSGIHSWSLSSGAQCAIRVPAAGRKAGDSTASVTRARDGRARPVLRARPVAKPPSRSILMQPSVTEYTRVSASGVNQR